MNGNFSNAEARNNFWNSIEIQQQTFGLLEYITSTADRACIFTKDRSIAGNNLSELQYISQQDLADMLLQAKALPSIEINNLWVIADATSIVQKIQMIFARLHSSPTLILCSEQSMPQLENALNVTKTKIGDHRKVEEEINQYFKNPAQRYSTGCEYDWNFPLSRSRNYIREISLKRDFSYAIVGDVTVVIERKMVFSGAANDFFQKAFNTIQGGPYKI